MGLFDGAGSRSRGGGLFGTLGGPRKQEQDTASVIRRKVERLEGIAAASDQVDEGRGGVAETIIKLGTPVVSVLDKALNIINRPLFTITGIADESLKKGSSVGDVLNRAKEEFFSGLGGLEGQKKNFGQVLADSERIKVPEFGNASSLFPGLFNDTGDGTWKFRKGGTADITGRDVLGFGLDIGADPVTHVSFGTGRAAIKVLQSQTIRKKLGEVLTKDGLKRIVAAGKVPLTKKGLIEFTKREGQHLPRTRQEATIDTLRKLGEDETETVERLIRELPELADDNALFNVLEDALPRVDRLERWTPQRINQAVGEVEHAARKSAGDQALQDVILMANRVDDFIDPGGFKFRGKTLLSGDKFRTIARRSGASAVVSRIAKAPLAAQFARMGRGIDAIFSESTASVRNIPGARQARATARAKRSQVMSNVGRDIREMLPKSWRKLKVGGMRGDTYMLRHLDNPTKYPVTEMPTGMQEQVEAFRNFFLAQARDDAAMKGTSAGKVRANYVPIILNNSKKSIESFVEQANKFRGRPHRAQEELMQWGEVHAFDNIDEMEDMARQLKEAGVIDFKPQLVTNLGDVMRRRGSGHANIAMFNSLQDHVMTNLGVDAGTVARDLADRTFPGLRAAIERGETNIDPSKIGRAIIEGLDPVDEKTLVVLRETMSTRKLTPDEKTLVVLGRMRNANSLDEFERLVRGSASLLEEAAPGLREELGQIIGSEKAKYLHSFSEPLQIVKDGPFQGIAYPTEMAKVLQEDGKRLINNKDAVALVKRYDIMQSWLRMWLTGAWPAFNARNGMTNVGQNFVEIGLAAMNPAKAAGMIGQMLGREGTLITRGGRRYTNREIGRMSLRFGVIQDRGAFAEIITDGARSEGMVAKLSNIGRVPGTHIENSARMMLFREKLRQGLDPAEAAARVNRVLFDYGEMSTIEREGMRRLFLFPKWMRENVELQVRAALTEPGRVSTTLKLGSRIQTGPDPDMLPEYKRGEFKIGLNSRASDKAVFITGMDIPFGEALEQVFGTTSQNFVAKNVNSMSPFVTLTMEIASGRDLFRGRSIREAREVKALGAWVETLPKPMRDYLEFRTFIHKDTGEQQYTLNGTKAHIMLKASGIGRFVGTADRFNKLVDSNAGAAWVDLMTGIDIDEFDMDAQTINLLRAREDRAIKILQEKGVLKAGEFQFVTPGSPESDIVAAAKQAKKKPKKRKGGLFNR